MVSISIHENIDPSILFHILLNWIQLGISGLVKSKVKRNKFLKKNCYWLKLVKHVISLYLSDFLMLCFSYIYNMNIA